MANRLALDEAVATEWSRALRSGAPLSVLMIDVDHFKAYNDHYGHVAGDLCLQRVAQALSLAVGRVGDMVARYGGEEFAVLLPDTDASQATVIGQRLCAAVRTLRIEHLAAHDRQHITVSIGAASALPAFTATRGCSMRAIPRQPATRRATCSSRPTRHCIAPSNRVETRWWFLP